MPVDTNILRVSKELGLVGNKESADKVSRKLESMLPKDPKIVEKAHNNLLALGQVTSRRRNQQMIEKLRALR